MEIYGQYGNIAIKIVENILSEGWKGQNLKELWDNEAKEDIDNNTSRKKSCPKNAFLGLCETGSVLGIPPGYYTDSRDNKNYAVMGLLTLREKNNSIHSPNDLWKEVMQKIGKNIEHNQQMNVVLSLWNKYYLR